jgi:single-strand DNA-binding protein
VSGSISKGDPVVVLGAISTQEWETDTGRRSKPQIKAVAVGHNLARGIASFTKVKSSRGPSVAADEGSGDPSDEAFGEPVDPLTGEVLGDAAGDPSEEVEGIRRGRDYVTDPSALHSATADDLADEPVHA